MKQVIISNPSGFNTLVMGDQETCLETLVRKRDNARAEGYTCTEDGTKSGTIVLNFYNAAPCPHAYEFSLIMCDGVAEDVTPT